MIDNNKNNFFRIIGDVLKSLLNFLFPKQCIGCNEFGSDICKKCLAPLLNQKVKSCNLAMRDGKSLKLFYLFTYNPKTGISRLIKRYKYKSNTEIAKILALVINSAVGLELAQFDYVIPSPISKQRFADRGFDHIKTIADEVVKNYSGKVKTANILSKKNILQQTKLHYSERIKNMKNSIEIHETLPINSSILLIDDVCTTGSTILECARVLNQNCYLNLIAFVIAKKEV